MVLNYIWIAFFLIAFAVGLVRLVFMGDTEVFPAMMNSTFSSAKTAFEISLGLTGVLSLWLGVMKIGERGGVVNALARVLSPVFTKLFPDIPKGHPATGSIFMNIAANMLGLDNAATPLGLKAMEQLQSLNTRKDTATNPMIMFLVLNTSGLTIIPVSILVYRAQMGAAQPTDVFIPILIATFFSTLAGVVVTSLYQRINLLNRTMLLTLGGMSLAVAAVIWLFGSMDKERMNLVSTSAANILLMRLDGQGADEPREHYGGQYPADVRNRRFHRGRHEEACQRVRCLHRGRQGRLHHGRQDNTLSRGDTRWNRRFSRLGRHGRHC